MSEGVVDLSSGSEIAYGEDSDDDYIEVSAGWICRKCTATNDGIAAECSICSEPNLGGDGDANGNAGDLIDLTGAAPILKRAGAYFRHQNSVQLDTCSCVVSRGVLQESVRASLESLPSTASTVNSHYACPACAQPLSRRDVMTGAGNANDLLQADRAIYGLFLQQVGARTFRRRADPAVSDLSHQLCIAIEKLCMALTGRNSTAAGCSPAEAQYEDTKKRARTMASGIAAAATGLVAVFKGDPLPAVTAPTASAAARGLAKGTGYGGNEYGSGDMFAGLGGGLRRPAAAKNPNQDGIDKAHQRENEKDKAVTDALKEAKGLLDTASGKTTGNPLQSPGMAVCSVVFGGPLARLLRFLLLNDSLMDIGRRRELYVEVIHVTHSLARCVDYLTLFLQQPDEASAEVPSVQHTVLDALRNLNTQCHVFKSRAEDLEYTEEETAALSLALDINNVYEELQKATDVLKITSLAPTATCREVSTTEDQATLERRYIDEVSQYRLRQWPLVHLKDFYFRKDIEASATNKKSQLRICQEMSSLSTSLPIAWGTSIFLVADENRMEILRALVVGPDGTPYANGIFLFDILLPAEYPSVPPKVQFLTTGAGRVRFNPNLYENGKVCLSLLGTWSGPAWDPANSTLLQVLVSIQSMIFIDDPYFNEPGHESTAGTQHGKGRSEAYNRNIRMQTLRHALLPAIQKPPPAFKELLRKHFEFKYTAILEQCKEWGQKELGLRAQADLIKDALEDYRPKTGTLPGASWQSWSC